MENTLQRCFPQIRARQEVIDDIMSREQLKTIYETWNEEEKNYFLIKILKKSTTSFSMNKVQENFMYSRSTVFTEVNKKQIQV